MTFIYSPNTFGILLVIVSMYPHSTQLFLLFQRLILSNVLTYVSFFPKILCLNYDSKDFKHIFQKNGDNNIILLVEILEFLPCPYFLINS